MGLPKYVPTVLRTTDIVQLVQLLESLASLVVGITNLHKEDRPASQCFSRSHRYICVGILEYQKCHYLPWLRNANGPQHTHSLPEELIYFNSHK